MIFSDVDTNTPLISANTKKYTDRIYNKRQRLI